MNFVSIPIKFWNGNKVHVQFYIFIKNCTEVFVSNPIVNFKEAPLKFQNPWRQQSTLCQVSMSSVMFKKQNAM